MVLVGAGVGVLVAVAVGIGVGVFVGVAVGILVAVGTGAGVLIAVGVGGGVLPVKKLEITLPRLSTGAGKPSVYIKLALISSIPITVL